MSCIHSTLYTLQHKYRCKGIKTSFEDEGAHFNDVIALRNLTSKNNLKLSIKVGGCEAKTDIKSSIDLCCDSIVGPMIETKYAFEKYMQSVKSIPNVTKGVNIETITAINNMDYILSSQHLSELDYFVIGRVDLMGSMEKSREYIDSPEVLSLVEKTFKKVKKSNKLTYLGGSIGKNSKDFIKHLYSNGLLDYIETRYIIMKLDDEFFKDFDEAIRMSHQFEVDWLQHLHLKYSSTSMSLSSRIDMARTRVEKSFKIDNKTLCFKPDEPIDNVSFINDSFEKYIEKGDFIITDARFQVSHKSVYYIKAEEQYKTIDTVMLIISSIPSDTKRIVVVGGGLIQDVGSFVSSIYNRGIPWIFFPTTLLSMADSCIGSKTSLNTSVKNKIGTFYAPKNIYINTDFLKTLDESQIKSGLGEILKLSMIGNSLELYKKYKDADDTISLIKLSLNIKNSVIQEDLYDNNIRRALNYGHTIGHAIEVMSDYTIPHGMAIVHGMRIINKMFSFDNTMFNSLCSELVDDLPSMNYSRLEEILKKDKKVIENIITFVVPKECGHFYFSNDDVTSSSQKILSLL
jgi:3-dehydroquinate synthetase